MKNVDDEERPLTEPSKTWFFEFEFRTLIKYRRFRCFLIPRAIIIYLWITSYPSMFITVTVVEWKVSLWSVWLLQSYLCGPMGPRAAANTQHIQEALRHMTAAALSAISTSRTIVLIDATSSMRATLDATKNTVTHRTNLIPGPFKICDFEHIWNLCLSEIQMVMSGQPGTETLHLQHRATIQCGNYYDSNFFKLPSLSIFWTPYFPHDPWPLVTLGPLP